MVKEIAWQLHQRRQIKIVLHLQDRARTDMLLLQNLLLLHCPCLHIIDLEVRLLLHILGVVVAIVDVAAQCLQEIILHVIILLGVAILLHTVVVVLHLMNDHLPMKAIHQEKATTHVGHLQVLVLENIQAAVVVELLLPHRPCSAHPTAPRQPIPELNDSTHI